MMGRENATTTHLCIGGVCLCLPLASYGQIPNTPLSNGPVLVDGARIVNADSEPGDWISYGRTYNEQRFSPLDKINDTNANQLGLAPYFDRHQSRPGNHTHRGGRHPYVSTAWSKVKALDAKTGTNFQLGAQNVKELTA
jgi:quinohemoprotein ethanol dehydrogenase